MTFRKILPPEILVAEGWLNELQGPLIAPENKIVERAVAKRRREFIAGRTCARAALWAAGFDPVPILVGDGRQPRWPQGVVGSITHSDVYCAAAVARRCNIAAIGIDTESNTPLEKGLTPLICTKSERIWCEQETDGLEICGGKLVFSIKESIFKAAYPSLRVNFGFQDIEVNVELCTQSFRATAHDGGPLFDLLPKVRGKYALCANNLIVAAWIPATDS